MADAPQMNPEEAASWLSSLELFGIKLGLDQTRELFAKAGNPERKLKFLHVAGSNGKGSVCALLDAALRNAGFKTGFYSSPHLVDARERFRVCGEAPSREAFAKLVSEARGHVEALRAEGLQPTYFETTTLMAASHFANEGVDFAIWETGMGGRLDATNIVRPLASIITSVSLEHKDRLGDTLAKIAFEKAGILKPEVPAFSAQLPEEALAVLRARAADLGAPLTIAPRGLASLPFEREEAPDGTPLQSFKFNGRRLAVSLLGPCQRANAALAAIVLERLAEEFGFEIEKALAGFAKAKWPARLQFLPALRTIIDGAHNPEAAAALAAALEETLPGERFQVVLGSFKDKSCSEVVGSIAPLASSFVFVPVGSARPSWSPDELLNALELSGAKAPAVKAASLDEALAEPPPPGVRRLICGSLHLCGEALAILQPEEAALNL